MCLVGKPGDISLETFGDKVECKPCRYDITLTLHHVLVLVQSALSMHVKLTSYVQRLHSTVVSPKVAIVSSQTIMDNRHQKRHSFTT